MKCRNTKVFIRVLPNVKNCWEDIKILQDRKNMYIRSLQDDSSNGNTSYWPFETDGVFYNDSQIQIYNTITEGILERAIFYGNNALILAYGQTGTGKSLTISGLNASYQDRGILPRFISDIFQQKADLKSRFRINVDISYVETRRNDLKDLIVTNGPYLEYNTIKNVTRHKVLTEDETMKLLFIADGRRSVAADNSHTSNAVFTFYITTKSKKIQEKKFVSKIHIVDLVGADRYGYETCHFKTAYDVSTGNLAKSQLEQFFNILSENIPEKTAVFQHLNILIYYIRDTLSTDNILRFIGHIRSNRNDLVISLSMLRFAQILRGLKANKLRVNVTEDEENAVKQLEDDYKRLRKELDLNSMLNNESLKGNVTQERIEHMESVAEDYLRNKTNELVVLNVCDATTVMKVFKNLYNKLQIERDQFVGAADRLRKMQDDSINRAAIKRDGAMGYSAKNVGNRRGGSLKSANSFDASNFRRSKTFTKKSSVTNKGLLSLDKKTDQSSVGTAAAVIPDGAKSSRTSSRTLQKSSSGGATGASTSKRRSSQLADIFRDPDTQDNDQQVPSAVPSFDIAWASFLASDAGNIGHYNEVETLKDTARDTNRLYIVQVRLLNDYRAALEARQDDLLKARSAERKYDEVKMQLEIDYGNQQTGQLEVKCEELLKDAQGQFLAQQEVVLKYQTELKLYVQQCNIAKKDLNNKYNVFCKDSYKTVVPALPELDKKTEFDVIPREAADGESHPDDMETDLQKKTDELLNKYEQFKEFRTKECDKKRSFILKNKKWIRSCKA